MKLPKAFLQFLHWFPHQSVAFVACVFFLIGLLAGRAVMSVGMMLLLANALINLRVKAFFYQFLRNKTGVLLAGLFILFGLSFFWSTNAAYYTSRMQLMLPFLVLPFAFQSIKWEKKFYDYLALIFIAVCVVGAVWSLYYYLQDKENIDAAYGISKSMPTPFFGDHIRFGVAVVIAISFCMQLIKSQRNWRWILIGVAFFLMVYSHLLASKTALLSLYIISFYEIFIFILRQKKIMIGLSLFALLFVTPIIFYYSSHSFQNKVGYTVYSFEQLFNNKAETNISDEGRIVSYKMAWGVYKSHWLLGVGVGDGFDEMEASYARANIQTEKILYPHNQFLYMALVLGTVGLFYFVFLCFYLFKKHFGTSDWLSSCLLLFIVPFLVEVFLNTQYGIALFLFFFLLLERRAHMQSKIT